MENKDEKIVRVEPDRRSVQSTESSPADRIITREGHKAANGDRRKVSPGTSKEEGIESDPESLQGPDLSVKTIDGVRVSSLYHRAIEIEDDESLEPQLSEHYVYTNHEYRLHGYF